MHVSEQTPALLKSPKRSTQFPRYLTRTPESLAATLDGATRTARVYRRELQIGLPSHLLVTALIAENRVRDALFFAHNLAQAPPTPAFDRPPVDQSKLRKQQIKFRRMVDNACKSKDRSELHMWQACFVPLWYLPDALLYIDWLSMPGKEAQQYAVLLQRFHKVLLDILPEHWIDQFRGKSKDELATPPPVIAVSNVRRTAPAQ